MRGMGCGGSSVLSEQVISKQYGQLEVKSPYCFITDRLSVFPKDDGLPAFQHRDIEDELLEQL